MMSSLRNRLGPAPTAAHIAHTGEGVSVMEFPQVEQEIITGWPNQTLTFTGEWREFPVSGSRRAKRNRHRSMYVPVYQNKDTNQNVLMMTMSIGGKASIAHTGEGK
jgi:hypothetical protein